MTTSREETMRAHPDFPWLEAGDPVGVERVLSRLGWLLPGERILSADHAGEGNMNLTLRVVSRRRRFILKQARPWVEKYPEIPAPWDRSVVEQQFYERIASIPEVASRMPALLGRSSEYRLLALEDLPEARDSTSIYAGDALSGDEIDSLADYLAALHSGTHVGVQTGTQAGTQRGCGPGFANRAMRALNHEHIFRVPLDPANGLDLERHEPGLRAAALRLIADRDFTTRVGELGQLYLEDGRQLVHGDCFPGSWLRTRDGLRIIDPEFAHCGAAEFDLGCAVAHLALANRPAAEATRLLERHRTRDRSARIDPAIVARFAAIEVVRRLIGVAQLPIPPSRGTRCVLLDRARSAMLDARREVLFP